MKKIKCDICGRDIQASNFARHRAAHNKPQKDNVYTVDHDGLNCKFCNKLCKNLNSLTQHELRCSKNPNKKSWNILGEWSTNNLKGQTKETSEVVAKQAETMKENYASGKIIPYFTGKPGTFTGKHHSEESKKKTSLHVSASRLAGYRNGSITPAPLIGKGKYSYIQFGEKRYMLRSTYEFIYALYLLSNGIKFNMEDIRVPAVRENKFARTFICDFNLYEMNTVVEIKGIPSEKDEYIKESFEAKNYIFIEYFKDDIQRFKEYLINIGYDMDDLIAKINLGHNTKNYFTYIFN